MSLPIFFFTLLPLLFLFHSSQCTTILVDGSSVWKNPTVSIGDSIIFKHKQKYNIYIFKNQKAFDLCNFRQATLLTNPNTASYTVRPKLFIWVLCNYFYFSFNDGSFKACQGRSEKLAIKVTSLVAATPQASAMAPELSAAPSFSSEVPSSSPFHPLQAAGSPSPSATTPLAPYKSGSLPFISSNPAVPLPTDEVNSAAIRPLPTSSAHQEQVMLGSFGLLIGVITITLLLQ
ncbi:hypothetical protein Fmac_016144 [Flemingia macrophylla]|uniref:Cupredoxin n=1 Tax=Flemingia macrophylla TaxID=520843 RepID=A0ABD1MGK4_9FABA